MKEGVKDNMNVMDKKFKDMTIPEKIGAIIGWMIGITIVAIIAVAIISKEMSLWDVICWFMSAIGWYMIAIIVGAIALFLLLLFILHVLPLIAIICIMLGLYLIFSGVSVIVGVILLVVAVILFGIS